MLKSRGWRHFDLQNTMELSEIIMEINNLRKIRLVGRIEAEWFD